MAGSENRIYELVSTPDGAVETQSAVEFWAADAKHAMRTRSAVERSIAVFSVWDANIVSNNLI